MLFMMHGRSSSLSVFFVTGGYFFAVRSSFCSLGLNPRMVGISIASADEGRIVRVERERGEGGEEDEET